MRRHLQTFIQTVILLLLSSSAWAQLPTNYLSTVDEDLTLQSIGYLPSQDNVGEIYSKPIDENLSKVLNDDYRWNRVEIFPSGPSFDQLIESPMRVAQIQKSKNLDGLLSVKILKGPGGLQIRMALFVGRSGLPLIFQELNNFDGFQVQDILAQTLRLYQNLKRQIPYSGLVLSRRGQMLTVNLGMDTGIKEGDEFPIIQIISIERHPKYQFMVRSNKEILGRAKVTKVEEKLSFATLILEREAGVIQPNMKIQAPGFVEYDPTPLDGLGKIREGIDQSPDKPVAFGQDPQEWVPERQPSFGEMQFLLGLGTHSATTTIASVGGLASSAGLTPSAHFRTGLWLTTNWSTDLVIRQYLMTVKNDFPGSNPQKLNGSMSEFGLSVGYSLLLNQDFWGPKLKLLAGYGSQTVKVDTSSPLAYTTMTFSGPSFGVQASLPVPETPWSVGGRFNYYWEPTVDESPLTSGASSTAQIFNASGFGAYKLSVRSALRLELVYDSLSASYTGGGSRASESASSTTHNFTTWAVGLEYLF